MYQWFLKVLRIKFDIVSRNSDKVEKYLKENLYILIVFTIHWIVYYLGDVDDNQINEEENESKNTYISQARLIFIHIHL